MVGGHYTITMNRILEVKSAFAQDLPIICESRATRKVSPIVIIQKSKEWAIEKDNFVSPHYSRPFFVARCLVK